MTTLIPFRIPRRTLCGKCPREVGGVCQAHVEPLTVKELTDLPESSCPIGVWGEHTEPEQTEKSEQLGDLTERLLKQIGVLYVER